MQFLPALTRDPKVIAREAPAGAHLPYARHIDDATIETRDGLLMQTIHIGGLLFETADSEELNYRAELRDAMLRALGNSRFAVYHHLIRKRADAVLDGDYPEDFAAMLDRRWRERLANRQLYVNDLYLTIVRRPLQGKIGIAERIGITVTVYLTPEYVIMFHGTTSSHRPSWCSPSRDPARQWPSANFL